MGPLELQLKRDLAIEMVRIHAQAVTAALPVDEQRRRLRHLFEQTYRSWATTPRLELGNRTPVEAIRDERRALGRPPEPEPDAPIQRVELYTDLPQAEDETDCIELDGQEIAATAPADAGLGQYGLSPGEERPEHETPHWPDEERLVLRPIDEARWRSFVQRYLRG